MTRIATALLVAMAVASGLILLYGESPAHVYAVLVARTWGDAYGLGQVIFRATPLVFTGLAVAFAFRAGLFNIGAEGQLLVGSFVTAIVGAALPAPIAVVGSLAAGALAGALLAGIAGALRARFGAHEVITTIMLNFIAQALVLLAGREAFFLPETVHTAPVAARLAPLGASTAASTAFFLALAAAVACHVFLFRLRPGFELRAFGASPLAAQAAGVSAGRTIVLAMGVSGALAGLVGAATVLGYKGYFEQGMGSGAGFMGIAVALLARNHPLAIVPAALFFGTLAQGGLAANALVPKEIIEVIQAVIILAAAGRGR
jgi:simple sugar transport system permease protein